MSCTDLPLTAADAWQLLLVLGLMVGLIALAAHANADFCAAFSLQEDL